MEATGHYWLSVYGHFAEQGCDVRVMNPIQSDAFSKMCIRQTKNDSKDSFIIAQVMRFGQSSQTTLSDENIVTMKPLTRFRMALIDNCVGCKRWMIALLDQVFPEYACLFSDTFGATSEEVPLQCPAPEDMFAVSARKLINLLNKAKRGRFGEEKLKNFGMPRRAFWPGFCQERFCVPDSAAHGTAHVFGKSNR